MQDYISHRNSVKVCIWSESIWFEGDTKSFFFVDQSIHRCLASTFLPMESAIRRNLCFLDVGIRFLNGGVTG